MYYTVENNIGALKLQKFLVISNFKCFHYWVCFLLHFAIAFRKNDNNCCPNKSYKSITMWGENKKKKSMNQYKNYINYWKKEINSNTFSYRKVRRAITLCRTIEKNPLRYSNSVKIKKLISATKIISYFGFTNHTFAE